MTRIQVGDEVAFHGVAETVVAGTVTDIALEEGYISITVLSADGDQHVIASGGHFGDSFAIEGAEECFLQGGRR
jgi:hypothetical protein